MTVTTDLDMIVDAIDWDAAASDRPSDPTDPPTAADRDPDLYDFVSQAAACIPDPQDWLRFKKALAQYQASVRRR
jgi:hypothetical protein